ncbi:MAG: LbtU family siderophore porin [bacterium]
MKKKFFDVVFILGLCFLFILSLAATRSEAALEISGLVETEFGYVSEEESGTKRSVSDVTLATVEIGLDADICESVKGNVVLLWEEDETEEVVVDSGTITIANEEKCPFSLTIGRMFVPFGNFATHFISDPFTLELGETSESALLFGYTKGLTSFSLGFCNGDISETDSSDDDMINTFVMNLTFDIQSDNMPITFGVGYITNIADTDAMQSIATDDDTGTNYPYVDSSVGGLNVFLTSKSGPFTLEAEYIQAMSEFESGDLGLGTLDGKKPGAWNVELAYEVSERLEIAGKYEQTMDQEDIPDAFESRFGVAASYGLYDATTLGVEILNSTGYEPAGGGDEDTATSITAQLAIEF